MSSEDTPSAQYLAERVTLDAKNAALPEPRSLPPRGVYDDPLDPLMSREWTGSDWVIMTRDNPKERKAILERTLRPPNSQPSFDSQSPNYLTETRFATSSAATGGSQNRAWILAAIVVAVISLIGVGWLASRGGASEPFQGPADGYVPTQYENAPQSQQIQMPNFYGMPVSDAISYAHSVGIATVIRGSAAIYGESDNLVSRQNPPAGTMIDPGTDILISD